MVGKKWGRKKRKKKEGKRSNRGGREGEREEVTEKGKMKYLLKTRYCKFYQNVLVEQAINSPTWMQSFFRRQRKQQELTWQNSSLSIYYWNCVHITSLSPFSLNKLNQWSWRRANRRTRTHSNPPSLVPWDFTCCINTELDLSNYENLPILTRNSKKLLQGSL